MTRPTPHSILCRPVPDDAMRGDNPVQADYLLAISGSSRWRLSPNTYQRSPRAETDQTSRDSRSLWGRLDDDVVHPYRAARWIDGQRRLNVKPSAGPPDGYGIITGYIEHAWHVSVDRQGGPHTCGRVARTDSA